MEKIDDMELLVKTLEFWTGFYFKDEKDCYEWAVDKAYPDMARHALKYKPYYDKSNGLIESEKKKKDKERADDIEKFKIELKKYVLEDIQKQFENEKGKTNINESWYKTKLKNICKKANSLNESLIDGESDNYIFTMGHAQKLLNMSIKYLWLLYNTFCIDDILKKVEKVYGRNKIEESKILSLKVLHENTDNLHIPLDSFVLDKLSASNTNSKQNYTAWSKISDFENYIYYQNESKSKDINNNELAPIFWELCEWHFLKKNKLQNDEL